MTINEQHQRQDELHPTDEGAPRDEQAGDSGQQMDDPTATLNQLDSAAGVAGADRSGNDVPVDDLSATAPGRAIEADRENDGRRPAGTRFTYPSGSKPLDGYTIKRGIGIGGFGEVYFALSDAGKEVALKRIQRNVDVELRGVSQCLNLKHGNLITLWDIRQDSHGEGWVVMEYVPGPNLRDVIEDHPTGLAHDDAIEWFHSIGRGVGYLHDHGIVHRDLKPGNIFFDADEQIVKIGDYGLSKFISCSRRSGQTESVGTFHYMAPEIGKGVYGKEIDIYALGIILYELMTGRVPFDGESSQEIIMKHLTADPMVSGVAEPYQRVIRQALEKDPDRRFRRIQDMLEALESAHLSVRGNPGDGSPNGDRSNGDRSPYSGSSYDGSSNSNKDDAIVIAHAVSSDSKPPKIEPMFIGDEPFFIGDDPHNDSHKDIVMGDVQDVVVGEPIDDPKSGPKSKYHHVADPSIEEPIARSVHGGWSRMMQVWNQSNMSTPVKVLLLVLIGFSLLINAHWLVPLCIVIGALYGIYYGFRSVVIWRRKNQEIESEISTVDPRSEKRELAEQVDRRLRRKLGERTQGERTMELTGSFLMSSVVVATLGLLSMAIAGDTLQPTVESLGFYAWLTLTGVIASWTLLGIAKFWDSSRGDALKRRFVLLAGGLFVGGTSFATSELLMVEMPTMTDQTTVSTELAAGFQDASGMPMLPAYLLYFAGLFCILRWWRQVDPLRRTRLSVVSVGVCLLWACLLNQLCQFPLPWGILLAGTVSFAVQIASPHLDRDDRRRMDTETQIA